MELSLLSWPIRQVRLLVGKNSSAMSVSNRYYAIAITHAIRTSDSLGKTTLDG
jgi:hypothetical protein